MAYFIARLLAEGLTWRLDSYAGKQLGIQMGTNPVLADAGSMYLAPIKDFIYAYQLFANKYKYGLTTDVNVSEEELQFENWKAAWEDFVEKWPEISNRYDETPHDYIQRTQSLT